MDTKRKANGATAREEDRSAKRRKTEDFDLTKGETPESTTVYGHAFLELIRRTADKSGRQVATNFETLPPRDNTAYYKATPLPISLGIVEAKLDNGEFENLAELESYIKRMISNAKEFYPRSSQIFDDAERIRKALSNFMTKRNPAYQTRGYQAAPTPLPARTGGSRAAAEAEDEEDEEDADGDEGEGAEDDDDAVEEETRGGSKRRSIILKRRGSERLPRNSGAGLPPATPRVSNPNAKPDHLFEDLPYKALGFQEAQEKVVEELIRYRTPDYDDAYFEPFINLPPRALKDYYKMITDPLSLKKLQKIVKGVHGRGDTSGVSDFKSWAAFEEKSQLLWENAYYYNEPGSEIYELAQELEKHFGKEVKQAKAVVAEPAQPKIKLKLGQGSETPSSSRKVTIHVRSGAESPAAVASDASAAEGTNGAKPTTGSGSLAPVEQDRSVSATPSATLPPKLENGTHVSPGPHAVAGQYTPGVLRPQAPVVQQAPAPPQPNLLEPRKLRAEGKLPLISRMRIQTFSADIQGYKTALTVLPNPDEMQQAAAINLPPGQNRIAILIQLPDFLQNQQFSLWTLLDKGPLKASQHPLAGQGQDEKAFELILRSGLNIIEAHLVAALPREERKEGAPELEVEIWTAMINVLKT